jgi:hypothetical protein
MTYITRTLSMIVLPETEPIFSEMATEVRITDESGGELVEVIQHVSGDACKICIEVEEWPALRATIDTLIDACRKGESTALADR